jgi:hypothetical protein
MRRVSLVSLWIVSLCLQLAPAAFAGKSLEIYFIDVEGGQSTGSTEEMPTALCARSKRQASTTSTT